MSNTTVIAGDFDDWFDEDDQMRWYEADKADIEIKEMKEERYFYDEK